VFAPSTLSHAHTPSPAFRLHKNRLLRDLFLYSSTHRPQENLARMSMAATVVPSTSFTSSLRRSSHFGRGLQSLHAASLRVPGVSLRAMPSVCSKLTTSSSSASTEEPVAVGGSLLAGKVAAYVKRLYFLGFENNYFTSLL
jgi:hypothetical protein